MIWVLCENVSISLIVRWVLMMAHTKAVCTPLRIVLGFGQKTLNEYNDVHGFCRARVVHLFACPW